MLLRNGTVRWGSISIGILLLVLTYEIHMRQSFFEVAGLAGVGILLVSAISFKTGLNYRLRRKLVCCLLLVLLFSYPITGYVFLGIANSSGEMLKPIVQMLVCIALVFLTKDTFSFLIIISIISAVLSIFSGLIYIFDGLWLWKMFYNRSMSIFFDPNYASALLGFGAVSALAFTNARIRYVLLFFCMTGAVLAFSKATIIALLITTMFYCYLNTVKYRTLIFTASLAASFISLNFYYDILAFVSQKFIALRIETGLNLRDIYWTLGLEEIKGSPLAVRSASDVINLISPFGINTSLHNTYIETAFLYGPIYSATLVVASILSIFFYLRRGDHVFALSLLYLVISANNFTYMLGSPNLMSFIFGLLVINGFIGHRQELRHTKKAVKNKITYNYYMTNA